MSLVLIGGFLFFILLLLNKTWLIRFVSPSNRIARTLSSSSWFEHAGWSGLFLFVVNTLLFGTTAALLFLLTMLDIPYIHLLIILLAVFASLYIWISIYYADRKKRRSQLLMGGIGSSFYLFLLGYAVYRIIMPTETSSVEHDQFMGFIAMFFFSIVTFTAWIVCFVITGLYQKNNR